MKNIIYIFTLLLFFFGCKEDRLISEKSQSENIDGDSSVAAVNLVNRISGPSAGNFSSDQTYNLNVIYFVPSDLAPATGFQERLSTLMLWSQDWFRQQMSDNGYPNTTFGLFTNTAKNNIRMLIIYGSKDKTHYDYNSGSANILNEINTFFSANPSLKKGDHNLIILPAFYMNNDGTPGGGPIGPPFYGIGKNCFALDYPGLDIQYKGNTSTPLGNAFVTWFGGLVHELGHGLNLPHNRQKVSEEGNPQKGMALMWAGNSTIGISPTFLTGVDAAVLSVNQVFSKGSSTFYGSTSASFNAVRASFHTAKQAIIIAGRFQSNNPVKNILCFHDPNVNNEGTGANKDYNAIGWVVNPIDQDSFYLEMPIAELVEKGNGMQYEAKLKLVHQNGNVTTTVYTYHFNGGVPVINFGDKDEYSKVNWQIIGFSSQEQSSSYPGSASRAIDDNTTTYWHTNWSQAPPSSHPHFITVDTKQNLIAAGISILQRQDSEAGRCKDIEVWTSTDNVNWTKLGEYLLQNTQAKQNISFSSSNTFRYLKVIVQSSYLGATEKNCSIAEIGIYK